MKKKSPDIIFNIGTFEIFENNISKSVQKIIIIFE